MPSKRKSKKNSTKRAVANSVNQPEVSTPSLDNKENVDPVLDSTTDTPFSSKSPEIPAAGPVGIGAKGAIADNILKEDPVDSEKQLTLPDFVQSCIDSAVGSCAVDTDAIISSIKQKVENGDYKEAEKPKAVENVQQTGATNSAIMGETDASQDKTVENVQQTDAPNSATVGETNAFQDKTVENVQQTDVTNSATKGGTNASQTNAFGAGVPLGAVAAATAVATSAAAVINKSTYATNEATNPPTSLAGKDGKTDNTTLSNPGSDSNDIQTSTAGERLPLGGTASIDKSRDPATSNITNEPPATLASGLTNSEKTVPSTVTGEGSVAALSKTTNFSDSIDHAIKSVVGSPAVDFDKLLQIDKLGQKQETQSTEPEAATKKSQDIKRPEAAAGDTNQPAMPSSTKTADSPNDASRSKSKLSEHRNSFLKKKNCIIL